MATPDRPDNRPLRVAIDTRALAGGEATGVGRYINALIGTLDERTEVELRSYDRQGPPLMGAQLMSPLRMRRNGADLLHGPANALPLVHPGLPGVVTIHDLAIYDHPEWFPGRQWFATRIVVPRSIRGADAVICPSVATRSSIERIFGVGAERCHVIPHGVEPDFARPVTEAVRAAVRSRYGLPDRYLLQVGTIQPRKNYVTTLRALARIPEDMRLPLVAVGSAGWGDSSVAQTVAQLGLERWVRFVGYAGLPDLPALYQMAEAAVFPSLDEGFGLPVLEALAAGTPLAASNAGALPEVAGEAALLSDPLDDVALAANLRRLVEDASTRARLVAAGRARAKEFTWSRSAAAHLAVYRSVAG